MLALGVAGVAVVFVRGNDGATAGRPGQEVEDASSKDAAKPRFDGTVNGIHIYPPGDGIPIEIPQCEGKETVEADPASAAGTELDFSYPPDLNPTFEFASACGDVIVVFGRIYEETLKSGSIREISRVRGVFDVPLSAPADRVKPLEVNGRLGVVVEPLTLENGVFLTESSVVLREAWGITIIHGEGDLRQIAAGVK